MGMCIYSICMIVFQGFILLGYILEAIEINDKPIDETKQNKIELIHLPQIQNVEKSKYFDNLGMRWSHNKKKKIK